MKNIIKIDRNRWVEAQQTELDVWKKYANGNNDWNDWWEKQFQLYRPIINYKIDSIIEVGCGPFIQNIRKIMTVLNKKIDRIGINDPLLKEYMTFSKNAISFAKQYNPEMYDCPLEGLMTDNRFDCVICINVLDHVSDVEKCMENMNNILNDGGILILGQDLTDDWDIKNSQEDIMHPMRFDEEYIRSFINKYKDVYYRLLNREEGRNPSAHYGTLLYIGQK